MSSNVISCATFLPGLTRPDAVYPGTLGLGCIPSFLKPPQCHNCAITEPSCFFIPLTTFFQPSLAFSLSNLGTLGYALEALWLTSIPSVIIKPTSALDLLE